MSCWMPRTSLVRARRTVKSDGAASFTTTTLPPVLGLSRSDEFRLEFADDDPQCSGREQARTQWAGGVGAERRQGGKGGPGFGAQVRELLADLLLQNIGALRLSQRGSSRGVGRRAERVRAHVGDARGLRS